FISNLTAAEAAQFQKRYFVDRLMKYARNLRAGNFRTFTADALIFLSNKVGSFPWLIARAAFRAVNKPMPPKLRNNAPMFSTSFRPYSPRPYAQAGGTFFAGSNTVRNMALILHLDGVDTHLATSTFL